MNPRWARAANNMELPIVTVPLHFPVTELSGSFHLYGRRVFRNLPNFPEKPFFPNMQGKEVTNSFISGWKRQCGIEKHVRGGESR